MRLMMQITKAHVLVKQPSISEGRKNKPPPAKTIWSHSRLTLSSSLRIHLKAKGSTDITTDRCRKALAQHHKEKTHSLVMSVQWEGNSQRTSGKATSFFLLKILKPSFIAVFCVERQFSKPYIYLIQTPRLPFCMHTQLETWSCMRVMLLGYAVLCKCNMILWQTLFCMLPFFDCLTSHWDANGNNEKTNHKTRLENTVSLARASGSERQIERGTDKERWQKAGCRQKFTKGNSNHWTDTYLFMSYQEVCRTVLFSLCLMLLHLALG